MKKVEITISQGQQSIGDADINIIIDVIRAFTVSYHAFKKGVKEIILVPDERQAFRAREKNLNSIISGEKNGYKIDGFDFGNSPYEISCADIKGKKLIQKTTNGVSVTLNSLNAKHVFVTGYVNALTLVKYIKNIINTTAKERFKINLVASHPTGDDDLACAEYLKVLLLENSTDLKELDKHTIYRIANCEAAKKFWDNDNEDFYINDIVMALAVENSDFVMEVIAHSGQVKLKVRQFNET